MWEQELKCLGCQRNHIIFFPTETIPSNIDLYTYTCPTNQESVEFQPMVVVGVDERREGAITATLVE